MRIRVLPLAAAVLVVAASHASAQSSGPSDFVRVSMNGLFQATSNDFAHSVTFQEFVEEGTIESNYPIDAGPGFDGGVIVRVWKGFGAGVSISSFRQNNDAALTARIPHPFQFDRHREVTGQANGLERNETGVHVQIAYLIPVSDRIEVIVAGGPSFVSVKQAFITDVEYTHVFPYDVATFQSAVVTTQTEKATGFNAGVDVAWKFSTHIGVGGLLRYARATIDFAPSVGNPLSVDVGGLQAGGGIRFSF